MKQLPDAMSARGFTKAGLERVHDVMAGCVARGEVPGAVTVLSRNGETHVDAMGTATPDAIFRIASMTKPITAVATLLLIEAGRLGLDEPVDRLLPELAERHVLKRIDGPLDEIVPAHRPISVRDLLTFRMGFGLILGPPDVFPIQKAIREQRILTALPNPPSPHAPDEWIRRLGGLPLLHQPGERWMYHVGSDVLGVLIARASGRPLEAFLRERIFEPLGMTDTGFSVPATKLARLAPCYRIDPETKALETWDDDWTREPAFPSGGGGLVSTVDDYLAFTRMLLNKGSHGRARLLSTSSVDSMTADQLTPQQKAASSLIPGYWDTHGWGFGVSVDGERYGWDGGFGTSWRTAPGKGLIAMLMVQRLGFPLVSAMHQAFWTAVDQALDQDGEPR